MSVETLEAIDRRETPVFSPPGVWTPRTVEELPALHQHPYRHQIIELLRLAERDIFGPLLSLNAPAAFAQQFEFLAFRYSPIRATVALLFLRGIDTTRFVSTYFDAARELRQWLVSNSWGLPSADLTATYDQYVATAQALVRISPRISSVPAVELVQLFRPITEVDFGLTSLTLAFGREINTTEWIVSETFLRTRRAMLDYSQAVSVISEHALTERVLSEIRPDQTVDQPSDNDLRSAYRRYSR